MAIYHTNLYMTTTGLYHDEKDGKWDIYVQKEENEIIAKELTTGEPLPIFIKADQEDSYIPQPRDFANIKDAIEKYDFCLYILESDLTSKNLVNEYDINKTNLSEENYPYYRLREIKKDLDHTIEEKQKVAEKLKRL